VKQELARLRALAVRVGAGDQAAAAQLLRQLEPRVRRLVRRVMRRRSTPSPLAVQILRELRQISVANQAGLDPEWLVRAVARNISATLVEQLRAGPTCWPVLRDTILG